TDEMSGKAVVRIQPAARHDGLKLGELVAVRGDEGLVGDGDVFFDGNGLVVGGGVEAGHARLQVVERNCEAAGNERQVRLPVVAGVALEVGAEGGVVIHQQAAQAVIDFAARRGNGLGADTVLFGQLGVLGRLKNLQLPQTEAQSEKAQDDQPLHQLQPALGEFVL